MSKSPLAGAFTENGAPAKKKKKTGALIIIAGVALATSLGGVFAANTTINLGGNIEFGQGVTSAVVCDPNIDTAIDQSFSGTSFQVSRVALSGIDATADACGGEIIKVSLLNSSGSTICAIAGTDAAVNLTLSTTTQPSTNDVVRITTAAGVTDGKFYVDASANCDASLVDRVALTTSE
jgi:hypothetical protein